MAEYETIIDRTNESQVAVAIGHHLRVKLKPTPTYFPADYVSEDETIYIEIRCRTCYREQYADFLISAKKVIELLRLRFDELNPAVYLAVAWTDAIGLIEVDFGRVDLVPFHRKQSVGTYQDDVMVSIPVSSFQTISQGLVLAKSKNWVGRQT